MNKITGRRRALGIIGGHGQEQQRTNNAAGRRVQLWRRLLLVLGLCGYILPLQAESSDSIERLTELLETANTISGHFSQLSLDATGTRLQETSGSLVLKRPGHLYWHTEPPMEQLLVANGEKVWLYDPDLKQVTIQAMDPRLTHTPALLLSGNVSDIAESFAVSHWREAGGLVHFQLLPKSPDTLFDKLTVSFQHGVISAMQLADSVGQKTHIRFMDVQLNLPVAEDQFVFEVSSEMDVIAE